jgi:hypothetical protein
MGGILVPVFDLPNIVLKLVQGAWPFVRVRHVMHPDVHVVVERPKTVDAQVVDVRVTFTGSANAATLPRDISGFRDKFAEMALPFSGKLLSCAYLLPSRFPPTGDLCYACTVPVDMRDNGWHSVLDVSHVVQCMIEEEMPLKTPTAMPAR